MKSWSENNEEGNHGDRFLDEVVEFIQNLFPWFESEKIFFCNSWNESFLILSNCFQKTKKGNRKFVSFYFRKYLAERKIMLTFAARMPS